VLDCRLAGEVGISEDHRILAQDGQIIELDENGFQIRDSICAGRVLIDGKGVGDVGRSVLKERRLLSEEGLVVVNMAFDEETGIVVYGPDIVSRGFVFETETGYLLQDAQCVVLEIVEDITPDVPDRVERMRQRIQSALRQYFFFTIGRRPVILPFLVEV
jgi:ribonuclease J